MCCVEWCQMREKVRPAGGSCCRSERKFALLVQNGQILPILCLPGEFCTGWGAGGVLPGEFCTGWGAGGVLLGEFCTGCAPGRVLLGEFCTGRGQERAVLGNARSHTKANAALHLPASTPWRNNSHNASPQRQPPQSRYSVIRPQHRPATRPRNRDASESPAGAPRQSPQPRRVSR